MHEFIRALRSAATLAKSPIGVIFCPVREWLASSSLYDRLEQLAVQETANLPNVHLLTSASISQRYPVDGIHDTRADEQAHIPYSNAFYAALATSAARLFFSLHYKAHKVIVLDCDNTLWRGVVGEDGVRGIEIDAAFKRWQEFLVKQQASGRLLCLCSKNNPDDVFAVIDQRNDMLLKREHIVSWRINWTRKSDNLRELAQELDLGLDSFIFIDDNPAEIDEVRSSLPEVLSLTFPKDPVAINHFIADTWVFDQLTTTEEDQKRTQMYRENADRERFRKSTNSFAEFLASLNLNIQIDRLTPATLARVSQLTYRTNQFNFSGLRRSESELQQHLQRNRMECLTVEVNDRFGDYGLVGAVIFGQSQDQLVVDTFLMSCRVLSKGVEHRLVNELGRIAAQRGLSEIAFYFADSGKNVPAKNFLDALPEVRLDALDNNVLGKPSFAYRLSRAAAERLVVTTREADTDVASVAIRKTSGSFSILRAIEEDSLSPWNAQLQVKTTLPMEAFTTNGNSLVTRHATEPANPAQGNVNAGDLEEIIAGTIRDALGIGRLGKNDNFFDLGAHSSLLVSVASKLEASLNVELPIVKLFQYPSVAALAGFLSSGKPQEGARRLVRDKGKSQRRKLLELRQAQLALEPTSA